MSRERELVRTYKEIRADYTFDPSIFNAEPDRVRIVKDIVCNRLDEVDRTIILLYADCGSYRKLAQRMGMSHMTIRREVLRIKRRILDEYEHYDEHLR